MHVVVQQYGTMTSDATKSVMHESLIVRRSVIESRVPCLRFVTLTHNDNHCSPTLCITSHLQPWTPNRTIWLMTPPCGVFARFFAHVSPKRGVVQRRKSGEHNVSLGWIIDHYSGVCVVATGVDRWLIWPRPQFGVMMVYVFDLWFLWGVYGEVNLMPVDYDRFYFNRKFHNLFDDRLRKDCCLCRSVKDYFINAS